MTAAEILSFATATFAYVSGAVSAILCSILVWQWGVYRLRELRREKPAATYEELRERALRPIYDGPPPRCYRCLREYIWPDTEPVTTKHLCLECRHKFQLRMFTLTVGLAVAATIAKMFW